MDAGALLLTLPSELPSSLLPARLELGLDRFDAVTDYVDLRVESAGWLREEAGAEAEAFGRDLLELEPLLERSYLLDQPNVAGMGIGAWDQTTAPLGANLAATDPETRRKRMLHGSLLEDLLADLADEEPVVKPAEPPVDPASRGRAADLVEAVQRIDGVMRALPAAATPQTGERLGRLRGDLLRRLNHERRHDPRLAAQIDRDALADPTTPVTLRAQAADAAALETFDADGRTRQSLPRSGAENPYDAAIDAVVAEAPPVALSEAAAVSAVRRAAAAAAAGALARPADSATAKRQVEKARRLFAEEIALTGGRPSARLPDTGDPGAAVNTLALRRALAERPGSTPRPPTAQPGELTPARPEIPIWSSRGARARIIGYLRAGERADVKTTAGARLRVTVPGRKGAGWIDADAIEPRSGPVYPSPLEPAERISPTYADRPGAGLAGQAVVERELAKSSAPAGGATAPRSAGGAPISVGSVEIQGLDGEGAEEASEVVSAALAQLPDVLGARLAASPGLARGLDAVDATINRLEVDLKIDVTGTADARTRGRVLADQIADALIRRGRSALS